MGHEAFGTIESVGDRVPPERIGRDRGRRAQHRLPRLRPVSARPHIGLRRTTVGRHESARRAWPNGSWCPSRFAWADRRARAREDSSASSRRPSSWPRCAAWAHRCRRRPWSSASARRACSCRSSSSDRGVEVHVLDINPDRVSLARRTRRPSGRTAAIDRPSSWWSTPWGLPDRSRRPSTSAEVGGTILILGLDSRPLDLTAQTIVRRQLVVRGSLTYDHPGDFEAAIALVHQRRRSEPERIVTDEYPLDDVAGGVRCARHRRRERRGFGSAS